MAPLRSSSLRSLEENDTLDQHSHVPQQERRLVRSTMLSASVRRDARQLQSNNNKTIMELSTKNVTTPSWNTTNGIIFDITSLNHTIHLQSLDIYTNAMDLSCSVLVYGRLGSHVGVERIPTEWMRLVNSTVNCTGSSKQTHIPASLFQEEIRIPPNATFALYLYLPAAPILRYLGDETNQTAFGIWNEHLGINGQCTTTATLFGEFDVAARRVFDGSIFYTVEDDWGDNNNTANLPAGVSGCLGNLTTTYDDNLGSYGNMFDVIAHREIYLHGIDLDSDVTNEISYEIYVKNNSFEADGGKEFLGAWTLITNGTMVAAGKNTPTQIRGFDTLTIAPNVTTAFYVTLTTPDLRYRNVMDDYAIPPNVGDICVQNNDLQINMGLSVGTYPLSDAYFGPRVWSGTLHYVSSDGPCPSEAPSMAPTISPTTLAPTESPTRGEPLFEGCIKDDELVTTFAGGTGAYGNMFTVTALRKPLTITTLEFHTDFAAGNVTAQVYTKMGDYLGFENDPSAWHKIAEGLVVGAGFGRGSMIARDDFQLLHVYSNETRALYVTLTTADIRYTRTEIPVGESIASNEYLSVSAGAGLANYPFASDDFLYHPRVFNGRIHYIRESECLNITSATYTFEVEHPSSSPMSMLIALVNEVLSKTMREDVLSELPWSSYSTDHLLGFMGTETSIAEGGCVSAIPAYSCILLDSKVSFEHRASMAMGYLKFEILNLKDMMVASLNQGELRVSYVGDKAQLGQVIITLSGELSGEMGINQTAAFEGATLDFLNSTAPNSGVTILGVKVTGQTYKREEQRRGLSPWSLSRWLQRSSESSLIEVTTSVSGEYRPPPEVDMEQHVDDAIDADPSGFQGKVQRSNPYFENVSSVKSERASPTPAPSSAPSSEEGGSKSAAVPVLCSLLPLLFIVLICWWRRKRRTTSGKQTRSHDMLGMPWAPTDRRQCMLSAFRQRLGFRGRALESLFDAYAPEAQVEHADPSKMDEYNKKYTSQHTYHHDPYDYANRYSYDDEEEDDEQYMYPPEEDFYDEGEDDQSFYDYEYDDRM